MRNIVVIVIATSILLSACKKETGDQIMNPITIKIGDSGTHFLQRNQLPEKGHVNKQPAGLNFYKYRWKPASRGRLFIEHGKYSFTLPHVLSVTGTEDVDRLESGLESFNFNAGIVAESIVSHNDARLNFITLLNNLLNLGWKPLISYNYPRLAAKQAFQHYKEDDNYGIPPDYAPTLDEWMSIDFGYWHLYAEDVFLKMTFRRDKKHMELDKPGAYLFSFSLRSKEEYAKSRFHGEDRENWQNLWVDKIKALKKERYAKEQALANRDFTIDSDYEEPKIHPADPVEPSRADR